MKRLLALCIAISLFACKDEPKIDYALFSGQIENPTDKTIAIYNGREMVKEMPLAKDGTFADTLKIESGYYSLIHGGENSSLFLNPGNEINVKLNTDQFDETITYTGKGSENNNYLAAKLLASENSIMDYKKIYSMNEAGFLAKMDSIKNTKLKAIKVAKGISEQLRVLENKNTEYDHILDLQSYENAHQYYTQNDAFKASDSFTKALEAIDYNNQEDYANLESYKRLVQSYYADKVLKDDKPSQVFKIINKDAFPELKNDLANMLNYNISPNNKHNEAFYNGLMEMSTDNSYKEALAAKYNTVKKLAKGMPSPKFVNYENHKGGTTSLEDLKGKYVYIDVWATWCGPCIGEIPALKAVEKQFHGKNIVFVSTSIDRAKDHNKWVEMVKEKELGGIQLMADSDWKSKFVTDYAIGGIPRFILIDPNGNIVDADAPRPSSPKLVALFKELKL